MGPGTISQSLESLEAIAQAQSEAAPAKCRSGNKVEGRLPVEGDVKRNVKFILYAKLGTRTKVKFSAAVIGQRAKTNLRADIEAEITGFGDIEIIGHAAGETIAEPAQVNFHKIVGAKNMLIGNFCAVTQTDTDSLGLCNCNCTHSEGGCNDKD